MWKRFRHTLRIPRPEKGRIAIPAFSDEALDEAEGKLRFTLPRSYREFVKQIGVGELFDYFWIYGPQLPSSLGRRHNYSIVSYNKIRREKYALELYDDAEKARRAVIVASTIAGEDFGWDPNDKPRKQKERTIYLFTRSPAEIHQIAETFREFICDFCDSDNRLEEIVGGQGEAGYARTFCPATVRTRS